MRSVPSTAVRFTPRTGFSEDPPSHVADSEPDSSEPVLISTRLNAVCKRPPYCFVNAGANESNTSVDAYPANRLPSASKYPTTAIDCFPVIGSSYGFVRDGFDVTDENHGALASVACFFMLDAEPQTTRPFVSK